MVYTVRSDPNGTVDVHYFKEIQLKFIAYLSIMMHDTVLLGPCSQSILFCQ